MNHIRIYEVGPRDGLQNEKELVPTHQKVELINLLSSAGFQYIEATSFVSPKWVPQMADAAKVLSGIDRTDGVKYAALTPNMKGLESALVAGADEVAIFGSASETFSQKNINCSINESIERFKPVAEAALKNGKTVRGYVSCIAGCPYEGDIAPDAVLHITNELLSLGCYQVSLGDTIGAGKPEQITALLEYLLTSVPANKLAGHFHDTGDKALANIAASIAMGLRTFDSAIGGLGGCPYAPGAKGNVSTTALVNMLEQDGWETGIDLHKLNLAETYLKQEIGGFSAR